MSGVNRYLIDHSFGWRELNDALIRVDGPSDDGSIREDELMVFATDHDAACRERDEEIARLREALSELVDIYEVTFREETDALSELRKARAALADTGKTT